jgi:penicillin-binding protein 2B
MSDDLKITGEMGIEKYFNDYLSGKDGYLKYQKDLKGYKIPNTKEIREEAVEGLDIYLTIDENIQLFTERVVKESYEEYKPEWMIMTVADAKTGRILGTTSSPSFDPNIKNIESYLNPLVSYTYEPGSTMKTFTYMAAMEKGTYKGDELFKSGKYQIGEDVISDWNNKGWGDITYDQGYTLSSNVAITNIVNKFINRSDLKKYFEKLGFGRKTGFTLPNEAEGKINFKYEVEVANAGFGQGITTTPIQFIQALTSIANDGVMLKPYIIDKIVDPNTGEIAFEGKKEEIGRVASKDTISKIKDLMYQVINGDPTYATGLSYKVDGCEMIGKTGTAQFVNPKTGKYETGSTNYLRSFSGMFPKEDPQIIIYVVSKRPLYGAGNSVSKPTVKLANDIIKYLNVNGSTTNSISEDNFVIPNLINNKVDILNDIKHEKVVIGDGDKIINQYPKANITLNSHDKLFVMTNGKNILLPNMTNWSNRDVSRYCNLVNLKCNIEGYGFVSNQDVKEGTNIKEVEQLNLLLKRSNEKVEVGN